MLCLSLGRGNEEARLHHDCWRRSYRMAARCACSAAGKATDYWILGSDASAWSSYTAAFVQRLRELGWMEGRTIAIEYRWSEGRPARNAEIAAEFVRMKVDVILTNTTAARTVKQATSVIPIVFPLGSDPVGGGLIGSLA